LRSAPAPGKVPLWTRCRSRSSPLVYPPFRKPSSLPGSPCSCGGGPSPLRPLRGRRLGEDSPAVARQCRPRSVERTLKVRLHGARLSQRPSGGGLACPQTD
jgi:hypothetical protein